jgi:alpha-glucosidase
LKKDPAINAELGNKYPTYQRGAQKDVFIKWPNGTEMLGHVWPEDKSAFPDFFLTSTAEWWKDEIINHYKTVLTFDG